MRQKIVVQAVSILACAAMGGGHEARADALDIVRRAAVLGKWAVRKPLGDEEATDKVRKLR